MNDTRRDCEAFRDELSGWLDGDISPAAAEHLAACDECRDLRHDARNVARAVSLGGRDYQPPADMLDRVLNALAARAAPTPASVTRASTPPMGTRVPTAQMPAHTDAPATAYVPPPAPPVAAAPTAPMAVYEAPAALPATPTQAMPQVSPWAPPEHPAPPVAAPVATVVTPPVAVAVAPPSPVTKVSPLRAHTNHWFNGLVVCGTLAAAAALVVMRDRKGPKPDANATAAVLDPTARWQGRIGRVVRAAADAQGGVEVKLAGATAFTAARESVALASGTTVRTDARTRARLELDDGSVLVLDRGTEVLLDASAPRSARILRGNLVADVMHHGGAVPPARIAMPVGSVEVLGTKFSLSASDDRSSVRVTRGTVRLTEGTRSAEVKTGQEGVLTRDAAPAISPAVDLADAVSWSELGGAREPEETALVGIGELRARRPGSRDERDEAIHLASHAVKVRIVGNMARTEVEEVFRNDTAQELEGIYRFPLPPDGQIEQLALDVNGHMELGAFVDRDRAAAIWRGVIRHATPHPLQTVEEFIWVPGPWRDPALLEWQRGGRFELRIFPIPAHGTRRVSLSYTQTIQASGGTRRYIYPLPVDPGGSLRIDNFDLDVQVMGNDRAQGVRNVGYALEPAESDNPAAQRFQMSAGGFVPSGDLMVEYALPDRTSAVTSWAFQPPPNVPSTAPSTAPNTVPTAASPIGNDAFVAFALRPTLPRWGDTPPRDYVFVVDSSRSMVGERSQRAARLVEAMISEMDRRDRFTVLACDARCQAQAEIAPSSAEGAHLARRFLTDLEPAGGSDLGEAVRTAMARAPVSDDRDVRVVYLGDGAATMGYRRPDRIAREVTEAMRNRRATLTTVALGTDSDTLVLRAMAQAGGGAMVPYVPGERVGRAALGVLEATYGVNLRDPVLTLPPGLTEVAPARLGNIRAGSETIVVARMHDARVSGEAVLRGTVGGEPFVARYPITVTASTDAGNAFVPRLFAATRIADLESEASPEARAEAIALSQRFNVASRYTSLLVLESAAMFQAFGVERNTHDIAWTGEQSAVATATPSLAARAATGGSATEEAEDELNAPASEPAAAMGGGLGTGGFLGHGAARRASREAAGADDRGDSNAGLEQPSAAERRPAPVAAPTVTTPTAPSRDNDTNDLVRQRSSVGSVVSGPMPATQAAPRPTMPPPPPNFPGRMGGQWMRRIWVRHAAISLSADGANSSVNSHISDARRLLLANPDSRDRHKELFRWLSVAGELDEAADVATRWTTRDALDPDGLTRLADVAARRGDRARSLRLLSGVVDVRQDDTAAMERLALLHERAGESNDACAYRLSLAEVRPRDAQIVARAVRCERSRGRAEQATRWVDELTDPGVRAQVERLAIVAEPVADSARGDFVVDATWDSGVDLDLSVIDPRGMRLSWQGGRSGLSARGPLSTSGEALGISRASTGDYLIEVSRTDAHGAELPRNTVIRGRVTISAIGERRSFPFTLDTARTRIARVSVTRESQMVPVTFNR